MDSSLGEYFEALYDITLRIASSLDLDDVLSYLTEETAKAIHARASSVRLLDKEHLRLEMRAVYGLSEAYLDKGPVVLERSPVDRAILGGQVSQLADVTTDPNFQYPEAAAREGIVSVASVPLIAHARPVGVFRVYSTQRRNFSDEDMRFLTAVADLAALCIENAKLYDQMRQRYEDSRQNYEATMNILWGDQPG
ncbi:MAG: GAF domain-containing protein [Chloroflexota bacterium]